MTSHSKWMLFCPCAGCHLSLAAFLKIIANRNKCQTICFMCDCSDLPRECACQAFHFYCPAVFRMSSCPPLPAPCHCCNICALHKAAAYSDCCRRNATRAIPVIWNSKTILLLPHSSYGPRNSCVGMSSATDAATSI